MKPVVNNAVAWALKNHLFCIKALFRLWDQELNTSSPPWPKPRQERRDKTQVLFLSSGDPNLLNSDCQTLTREFMIILKIRAKSISLIFATVGPTNEKPKLPSSHRWFLPHKPYQEEARPCSQVTCHPTESKTHTRTKSRPAPSRSRLYSQTVPPPTHSAPDSITYLTPCERPSPHHSVLIS